MPLKYYIHDETQRIVSILKCVHLEGSYEVKICVHVCNYNFAGLVSMMHLLDKIYYVQVAKNQVDLNNHNYLSTMKSVDSIRLV